MVNISGPIQQINKTNKSIPGHINKLIPGCIINLTKFEPES
jgi:hypothetical protein